jgi:hypothetical protein
MAIGSTSSFTGQLFAYPLQVFTSRLENLFLRLLEHSCLLSTMFAPFVHMSWYFQCVPVYFSASSFRAQLHCITTAAMNAYTSRHNHNHYHHFTNHHHCHQFDTSLPPILNSLTPSCYPSLSPCIIITLLGKLVRTKLQSSGLPGFPAYTGIGHVARDVLAAGELFCA